MKLFQKTSVAVALTVVMIAAAIGIGQVRGSSAPAVPQAAGLDKSLSTSSYATWISDEAEVLSDQEEQQICLYNANWVARYDSLIAVATVREVSGDIADYAYALGEQIQLGAADGILVVDTGTNNCYLAVGPDYPMTDEQVTSHLDRYLYENAMAGQFGTGVLSLFDGINQFYVENYGLGYLETSQNAYGGRSTGETVMSLVVLLVILGGVNLMSYQKVVSDADTVLSLLAANDGAFPKLRAPQEEKDEGYFAPFGTPGGKPNLFNQRIMSPETPYESRFFSVLLGEDGQAVETDTGQIAAVDAEQATDYAQKAAASGKTSGFLDDYRFLVQNESGGIRIIFLDCGRSLSSFRTTLLASVSLAVLGLAAVLFLLLILSRRIVRPMAESYEKQRQFITDAGHELKTPMTIISADADLAEMECGENQWLTDIRRQAQRLTALTNDLIYLSRMEEEQPKLQYIDFPISDVVEEMAQSFAAPARSQDKDFQVQVQPMLSFKGDEKGIRQLVSILLDNALKYSPPGGQLALRLEKQGRNLLLTVSNTCAQLMEQDKLPHLFDRFYRTDQSRNSQSGGYGLGLSIAKSIVSAHKGKIRAESPDGTQLTIQVTLAAG